MRSKTCCSTPISVNECLQVPCLNVPAENVPWGKEEEQQKLWGRCSAHSTSHLLTASILTGGRNLLMLLCATFKAQRPPSQVSSMNIFNTHSKDGQVVEPHMVHR